MMDMDLIRFDKLNMKQGSMKAEVKEIKKSLGTTHFDIFSNPLY